MMTQNVKKMSSMWWGEGEEEIMTYEDENTQQQQQKTTTEYHGLSSVDSIYRNNLASSIHTVSHYSHNKKPYHL